MRHKTNVDLLAARIKDRSMRGIAIEIAGLIRSGELPVGSQLPAVRDLAEALEVSPATVSGAWKQLRSYRMVSGERRTGIWVQGDQTALRPLRYEGNGNFGDFALVDLRLAAPDPMLLPDLSKALVHAAHSADLNNYHRELITPSLSKAARAVWPYDAPAFIATNGGHDALYLALVTCVLPGAYIAVENPATVRILDILDKVGARALPVESDEEGPLPESLANALLRNPSAFVFQPGVHATTGRRVTQRRLAALSSLLKTNDLLLIEDDGLGAVASEPAFSFGNRFPTRTVHIRSLSKSHGPDLRLAVMSAAKKVIDQVRAYRNFREGWTSRLLQNAAAWLLTDQKSNATVEKARDVYAERSTALSRALSGRGVSHSAGGLVTWIPVPSEQHALITLASRGIAVSPGGPCQLQENPHIRIATSQLRERYDFVADAVLACLHDPGPDGATRADY